MTPAPAGEAGRKRGSPVNAVKRTTEPLGGKVPSANPNPCAPGANQLADLVADVPALPAPPEDDLAGLLAAVTSADLARLLEDAPGLPGLCALSADELARAPRPGRVRARTGGELPRRGRLRARLPR